MSNINITVFAGLGNPGSMYVNTRHNTGFMLIDFLHEQWNFPDWKTKFKGLYSSRQINARQVILFKPQTYMNRSGIPINDMMMFYNVDYSNLVVVHDDIELASGIIRTKDGGGVAGHNGLRSIKHTSKQDFARIRIGIGKPAYEDMTVHDYVLGKFTNEELSHICTSFNISKEICEKYIC